VEGPCEHSIKCWEFLDAAELAASQEGLSSMQIVNFCGLL
jgi:hypothetical protein